MTSTTDPPVLLVPMKLDCFVLNDAVCASDSITSSKIAPISQPNYTFLRYDNRYLSSDILRYTDLQAATGAAARNPRLHDLGTGKLLQNRQGVYIHWTIPRPYRSGKPSPPPEPESSSEPPKQKIPGDPDKAVKPPPSNNKDDPKTTSRFQEVPTRWLVVRHIVDMADVQPREQVDANKLPELTAWVIESNHKQSIEDIDKYMDEHRETINLQTDVSPFIAASSLPQRDSYGNLVDKVDIQSQAEVFIGSKHDAAKWKEDSTRKRVDIDLSQSSNLLFADFQPHNGNVFSMIDPLRFTDDTQITKAQVSYLVLGWHAEPARDPLWDTQDTRSRAEKLNDLNMVLPDPKAKDGQDWLALKDVARTLCHGTMYDVVWDLISQKRPETPADKFCANLMTPTTLSVGTTPLDSIFAFAEAHKDVIGGELKALMDNLAKIETLLLARDEGVETQRRAIDMLAGASFTRLEGGKQVFLTRGKAAGDDKSAQLVPSGPDQQKILLRNQMLLKRDTLARLSDGLRWDMFSIWWKFLFDQGRNWNAVYVDSARAELRDRLEYNRLGKPDGVLDALRKINEQLTNDPTVLFTDPTLKVQEGVMEPFYQPNDPTLLVSGVRPGWTHDYLDALQVRIDFQMVSDGKFSTVKNPKSWTDFADGTLKNVMTDDRLGLNSASKRLLEEFASIQHLPASPKGIGGKFLSLYHDHDADESGKIVDKLWRDRWNLRQPFFPLYLEWEAEYVHIPFRFWKVEDSTVEASKDSTFHYVLDKEAFKAAGSNKTEGSRRLSGRSIILPQPSFSLESKVKAVFTQLPESVLLDLKLDKTTREAMFGQIRQLSFLSAPLAGFNDHLVTRIHGTHVKPNNLDSIGNVVPIQAALNAAKSANFEVRDLQLISTQSDLTPYGSAVQFADKVNTAFKPVAHGQFRFTKLNIIDKFGQAIHAIDPTISAMPKTAYACSGKYFAPQNILETLPAPIIQPVPTAPAVAPYEWIQIPPQINQYARINAAFVVPEKNGSGSSYWRPTTEWENPIWGWVMINHADYGLQFFLADGTYYCEVRVGGETGSAGSMKWLPFEKPKNLSASTTQLENLLAELTDPAKLQAFVNMIDKCLPTLPVAPAAYAEQMGAVVGRPLALANVGWSLELATERLTNQVLPISDAKLPRVLTEPDSRSRRKDPLDRDQKRWDPRYYSFEVKFGSREKQYDGLVGYFAGNPDPLAQDALDLTKLFTYYGDGSPWVVSLSDDKARSALYPFYFDPTKDSPGQLFQLRCQEQIVLGAIMDPFACVHAYTGILPIREIRLPQWTVQNAFSRMTTLFNIGPLLLTLPLPAGNAAGQVPVGEARTEPATEPTIAVPIPASTLGTWSWLQPYSRKSTANGGAGVEETFCNLMKIDKTQPGFKFESTPYTAAEGYLQLRGPQKQGFGS